MNALLSPSARIGVVAAIAPANTNPGSVSSAWIDMRDNFGLLAVVAAGTLGAAATVDAKFEQATSAGGAGAKDVPGTAIAQLTKASGDDNKQALINLRQENLDRNGGFRFARLTVTVATAASPVSGVVLCTDRRFGDATATDAASVDAIVGA